MSRKIFEELASKKQNLPEDLKFELPFFEFRRCGIVGFTYRENGEVKNKSQLSNFNCLITEIRKYETTIGETDVEYLVAVWGPLGEYLGEVEISARDFHSMYWVTSKVLGNGILPTSIDERERLRKAIQELSAGARHIYIPSKCGWHWTNGVPVYLHHGGCLGSDLLIRPNLQINNLEAFDLTEFSTCDELVAIRSSLEISKLTNNHVGTVLLAVLFRAPLSLFKSIDFVFGMSGASGSGKTTVAMLMQSHFGRGFKDIPPDSFESTINFIVARMSAADGTVFVVDDAIPLNISERDFDRFIRMIGNSLQRGRAGRDGFTTRRNSKINCLSVVTGEEFYGRESCLARMVTVDVHRNTFDFKDITRLQGYRDQGLFVTSMRSYIEWLLANHKMLQTGLESFQLRLNRYGKNSHKRLVQNYANLDWALETFHNFCVDKQVMGREEADQSLEKMRQHLVEAARLQELSVSERTPAELFISQIRSLFFSNKCHLTERDGTEPVKATLFGWNKVSGGPLRPNGPKIGFINRKEVALDLSSAFRVVKEQYEQSSGHKFPVLERGLCKSLAENGFIRVASGEGKNTIKMSNADGTSRYLIFPNGVSLLAPNYDCLTPETPTKSGSGTLGSATWRHSNEIH